MINRIHRSLLAAAAIGLAVLVAGCTPPAMPDEPTPEAPSLIDSMRDTGCLNDLVARTTPISVGVSQAEALQRLQTRQAEQKGEVVTFRLAGPDFEGGSSWLMFVDGEAQAMARTWEIGVNRAASQVTTQCGWSGSQDPTKLANWDKKTKALRDDDAHSIVWEPDMVRRDVAAGECMKVTLPPGWGPSMVPTPPDVDGINVAFDCPGLFGFRGISPGFGTITFHVSGPTDVGTTFTIAIQVVDS